MAKKRNDSKNKEAVTNLSPIYKHLEVEGKIQDLTLARCTYINIQLYIIYIYIVYILIHKFIYIYTYIHIYIYTLMHKYIKD